MKKFLLFLALATAAIAAPVSGSIGFSGSYTANHTDLTQATSITFGPTVTTGVTDGSFAAIPNGTPVTMSSLIVNPIALPAGPVWSVDGFSLSLTSLTEQFNTANSLQLYGLGTVTKGADTGSADWIATFNKSGNNFTVSSSSSAANVPEGGATAAMLGIGLVALGLFRFGRS